MPIHIGRRQFIITLGGAAAAWPVVVRAAEIAAEFIGSFSEITAPQH